MNNMEILSKAMSAISDLSIIWSEDMEGISDMTINDMNIFHKKIINLEKKYKERMDRKVVCYTDSEAEEETREFISNQDDLDFIINNYSNVEILTVEQCLESGIGFPS